MDDYCGSPFWNWTLSWNTDTQDPELTSCFQRTVLVWIPCVFLWVLSPFEYRLIRKSNEKPIPLTFMNGMKCGLITTLIIFQLFELTYDLFYEFKGYDTPVVDKYTPISKLVTFCLVLLLTVLNTNHGRRSSGILFIFWFLLLICEIPAFRTAIRNPKNHPTFRYRLPYVLELLYGPLVLSLFLLNCWADSPPPYADGSTSPNACPEKNASFVSRLFFFWAEGLARKGYTKALEFSDLWELDPENTSKVLNPPFKYYWQEIPANANGNLVQLEETAAFRKIGNDSVEVAYKSVSVVVSGGRKKNLSMAVILWRTFGGCLMFGSFLKLIQDLLAFVPPLILKLILDQIQEDKRKGREFEYWKDYFYVLILLAASFVGSLVGNQYMYQMNLIGLRIRTTVVGCLYRKALRISKASKEETSTGEIVNLMAVDAQRLTELVPYVTVIWSTPLLIGLSLYFLYGLLGGAVFAGLGTMLLLIPIQAIIGIKVKGFQTRQMKFKDKRIKGLNEILQGIKVLKLYAWEPPFEKQVTSVRESELKILRESVRTTAAAMFIWTSAPVLVAVVTFATYVWINDNSALDAQTAFVSLSLFNIMRLPLNLLPVMLVSLVQAGVGIKRINRYMNSPEVNDSAVTQNPKESDTIVIEGANFGWYEDLLTLKNINLRVPQGQLLSVVGGVGSGKSSLLAAILGETRLLDGRVNRLGSVAYVAQEAWIQNATVRENIICDLPYDPELYEEVIEATALRPDLRILPAGDKTEIGEKGINLSGGQRQRVALARAAYRKADIYLLDDPLSAVDSHVGKHIFESLLGPRGLLKDKTRVLITHSLTFLPQMDNIVVMREGSISESGSYTELIEKKGAFSEFLSQYAANDVEDELAKREWREDDLLRLQSGPPLDSERRPSGELAAECEEREALLEESIDDPLGLRRLIQDEEVETGNIKWAVVTYYLSVIGWPLALLALGFQLLFQACAVGSNIWLGVWSSQSNKTAEEGAYSRDTYLGIYSLLCLAQGLFIFLATLVMATGTLRASSFLHMKMLKGILRAPLSFFDTTPVGRVINRFSKDTDVTDNAVPMSLSSWLKCVLNVLAALGIIVYTTPAFVVVIIPMAVLYFLAQRFYVCTSRQLARLEAVSRSPIYSFFAETLAGAPTIRAFGWGDAFIRRAERLVDSNAICYFPAIVTTRYLTVFLESTGNVVVFFAFLFSVLYSDHLTTGMVGLALSYALQITHGLNWLVETTNNVENNLVAVERIKEFGETKQEAPWDIPDKKPPSTWPKFGQITFDGFQARYRDGLEMVLKGVSCKIQPGERIGICGRTGAGKSTLALSLFRIVEKSGGSIYIDGKDISEMGLHDLRRKLSIIPQDPVIFSGTLRNNLDPFGDYTDEELWRSLELAHLRPFIQGLPTGLEHELSEAGENLSVGQKQLICLARALLRRNSKVLVLDEATAAIDLETDEFVQEAIRREFHTCTVLTIAHRLNTIMDYSRILVLENGNLVEFDTPHNLIQNKTSVFHGLAKEARLI